MVIITFEMSSQPVYSKTGGVSLFKTSIQCIHNYIDVKG